MSEDSVPLLIQDSHRDLRYAQQLSEGVYAKSISESYYAAFYAAKALLLHLGIRSKSHRSVQAGREVAIEEGHLSANWEKVLEELHNQRNQAVYRYARRDWTIGEAENAVHTAERFIVDVEDVLTSG